ncbi:MAG: OmpH family outer membrane protein [Deltaproteobacteria bacterium]|nr:OmpH family outer membrane protein [Deltaproteobacteria bacterium]MBW1717944.1 OmpH family outer membrane protein [Deltaproteobacteria bacterium]MBW1932857.1 OmpH family outer membrane protein [Deltaproteobacteria bacterium]MBW1938905.1 OmpH family outer membrane protein [Deltaproteobacteria bacterium]MBW1965220.1 OmpH family outer membrane protein [Deltaproteobacteria bacterium]
MKGRLSLIPVLLIFLWTAVLCCSVTAGETAQAKIAVINMQKVVRKSVAGQKAMEKLNKKLTNLQKQLRDKQDEINAFKEDIEKKGPLMNEAARAEKEREYKKAFRDLQDEKEDAQFEMRQAETKSMEPILNELEKVVSHIGEEGGYTLILDKNMPGIYFINSDVDITEEVIKAYDNQVKSKNKKDKK